MLSFKQKGCNYWELIKNTFKQKLKKANHFSLIIINNQTFKNTYSTMFQ